jgi:uncharacterized protein
MSAAASPVRSWTALLAVFALVLALVPSTSASADADGAVVLASFDFDDETPDAAIVHPSLEVGPMSVARGTVSYFAGNPGSAMATSQWHEDDNHFEFQVVPPPAGLSLASFSFDEAASGTGPQSWSVEVVDAEGATEVAKGSETGTTSPRVFGSHTIELRDLAPRTEPFTFRVRGFDASSTAGTWRIDNVTLTGVTATPDPDPAQGEVLISHLATRGPQGAGYNFVEFHNPGSASVDVSGWAFYRCTGSGAVASSPQVTFPADTVLPAGGYLLTSTQSYADDPYGGVAPDFVYGVSITDGTGAGALLRDADGNDVSGVGGSTSDCREGAGVPGGTFPSGTANNTDQTAFTRLDDRARSTGDNATDLEGPGAWEPRNSGFDPEAPETLSLVCQAPQTITEGYAAEDGEYVAGKAITARASGGTGSYDFDVAAVAPTPEAGAVTVTAVDGVQAEVRFSDEVPGRDPTEGDGRYTVTIEVADDAQTATCDVQVRVVPVLNIGEVRGVVPDDADGRQHVSPYALGSPIFQPGAPVAVRGVVTQRTLEENAGGRFDFEGFFIQSLDADPDAIGGFDAGDQVFADGDDRTSDGLWISTGTFSTVRPDLASTPPQDQQYRPEPGDIVTLRGSVVESFQQTQMNSPFVVDVVGPGESRVDLDEHVAVTEVDPPDDAQQASVYWERLAGMQVDVPGGSLVVSGNDHFAPSTSEFWVIRGDHPVALREDPDARRVFRDYHPLANEQVLPEDGPGDQHGFRILLGSFGLKAAKGDATATIAPARSGDTLDAAVGGGLYFGFDKYQVMVDEQPGLTRGPDPSASSLTAIEGFDPADEYSVMVYNVENLYDFRSDPFSGCDLDPDVVPDEQQPTSTCTADEPGGSTVSPAFTYAPRSQAAYDAQRTAIAEQILVALDAPDLITIQEAEKQDVCVPVYVAEVPADSFMDCDLSAPADGETMATTSRGSGAPDTVEELALEIFIQSDGAVRYEASGDAVNGRDVRGITQAFLHRTDRVELVPVEELVDDPILGAGDAVDVPYPETDERTELAPWVLEAANPKAVNAQLPPAAIEAAAALGESIDGGRFPQSRYAFSRAVQVGKFRIHPDGVDSGGPYVERYVTSNHMSAGPDGRTVQRTEQARLNAAVAEAARDAGGQVLVTGDFNVFPRPDDPFPSFETDRDREPSDQLAPMYERGFTNLHDVIIEEAPANTYSFVFRGISQILDHVFVDDATLEELVIARFIHVNVDYPAATPGFEPGRGASDHDPLYARFRFETEDVSPPPGEVRGGPSCDDLPPVARARPCRAGDPPPGWVR